MGRVMDSLLKLTGPTETTLFTHQRRATEPLLNDMVVCDLYTNRQSTSLLFRKRCTLTDSDVAI
jgi:hypothetical protein